MKDVSIIYQIFKNANKDDELPFVYKSLEKAIKFCNEKSDETTTYFTRPSYIDETNYVEDAPVYIVAVIDSNYEVSFPIIYCDKELADKYMVEHPLKDAFYILKQSTYVVK